MRLSVISFTKKGMSLSVNIKHILEADSQIGVQKVKTGGNLDRRLGVSLYTKCKACADNGLEPFTDAVTTSLGGWTKAQMEAGNALLFIGACGIAVRAVAPYLVDKLNDVPVLVMDEQGRYVIPILSGHMGGANELAVYIAEKTGAAPVITTATDINGKFAVDLFARKNDLVIKEKGDIVKISAKVLAGREITVAIEPGHGGMCPPEGVKVLAYPPKLPVDIAISSEKNTYEAAVVLRPKAYIVGMGCKRGKTVDEIEGFIEEKLAVLGISDRQVYALSSISIKKDEPGLVGWCEKKGVLFLTYTAKELRKVEGEFHKSAFVEEQTGVDNVCERAALKACGQGGKLLCEKDAKDGMTIAVAKRNWQVRF